MTEPTRIRSAPECQAEEHELCDGNQGIVADGAIAVRQRCAWERHRVERSTAERSLVSGAVGARPGRSLRRSTRAGS